MLYCICTLLKDKCQPCSFFTLFVVLYLILLRDKCCIHCICILFRDKCCTVSVLYSRINASLVSCKSHVSPKASKGKAKTEILLSAPVNGGRLFVVKFCLNFSVQIS